MNMAAEEKRAAALEAILDHLLAEGLENTGIRRLASAAGISDRMLIYYFGSKNGLLTDALDLLSERTSEGLNLLIGDGSHEPEDILKVLDSAMAIPRFENAMKLFLEVAARGVRGIEPFRTSAKTTIAFWLGWLEARMKTFPGGPSPREQLALVEGRIMLHLIEQG